jgi:hypothetical protein
MQMSNRISTMIAPHAIKLFLPACKIHAVHAGCSYSPADLPSETVIAVEVIKPGLIRENVSPILSSVHCL